MPHAHETERLRLLPWAPGDLDAFHAIWGDPAVIFWGASESREASRERLDRVIRESAGRPDGLGWSKIVLRATGEVVGNVFLQPYGYGPGWALGYHVHRSHQGHGFATEASRALIDHALRSGEGPVTVLILPENAPSQRVAEKLGVTHVGTRMHADLLHDVYEAR